MTKPRAPRKAYAIRNKAEPKRKFGGSVLQNSKVNYVHILEDGPMRRADLKKRSDKLLALIRKDLANIEARKATAA